jgi:hypothetical protein
LFGAAKAAPFQNNNRNFEAKPRLFKTTPKLRDQAALLQNEKFGE